jgi:hypothetical protein
MIRGTTLVLTLTDAVTPAVWQMEMKGVELAAIELAPQGAHWVLRLRRGNGQMVDIATYETRDGAVRVLGLIHQRLAGGAVPGTGVPDRPRRQMILAGTALFLFITLSLLLFRLIPPPGYTGATKARMTPPAVTGVPQSADDVLQGPRGTP